MRNCLPLHCLLHGGMRTKVSRESRNPLINVLYFDSKKLGLVQTSTGLVFLSLNITYPLPRYHSPQTKFTYQEITTNHGKWTLKFASIPQQSCAGIIIFNQFSNLLFVLFTKREFKYSHFNSELASTQSSIILRKCLKISGVMVR